MTHKFGDFTQKITHRKSLASLQPHAIKAVGALFIFSTCMQQFLVAAYIIFSPAASQGALVPIEEQIKHPGVKRKSLSSHKNTQKYM